MERIFVACMILKNMVLKIVKENNGNGRLGKQIMKCFLNLTVHPNGKLMLKKLLPDCLKEFVKNTLDRDCITLYENFILNIYI